MHEYREKLLLGHHVRSLITSVNNAQMVRFPSMDNLVDFTRYQCNRAVHIADRTPLDSAGFGYILCFPRLARISSGQRTNCYQFLEVPLKILNLLLCARKTITVSIQENVTFNQIFVRENSSLNSSKNFSLYTLLQMFCQIFYYCK